MDASTFSILAAVTVVMSFNLTASLLCCRSLSRRVDRLEDRLDGRIDRVEQRLERVEQTLAQLVTDMATVKAHLGIAAPPLAQAPTASSSAEPQ